MVRESVVVEEFQSKTISDDELLSNISPILNIATCSLEENIGVNYFNINYEDINPSNDREKLNVPLDPDINAEESWQDHRLCNSNNRTTEELYTCLFCGQHFSHKDYLKHFDKCLNNFDINIEDVNPSNDRNKLNVSNELDEEFQSKTVSNGEQLSNICSILNISTCSLEENIGVNYFNINIEDVNPSNDREKLNVPLDSDINTEELLQDHILCNSNNRTNEELYTCLFCEQYFSHKDYLKHFDKCLNNFDINIEDVNTSNDRNKLNVSHELDEEFQSKIVSNDEHLSNISPILNTATCSLEEKINVNNFDSNIEDVNPSNDRKILHVPNELDEELQSKTVSNDELLSNISPNINTSTCSLENKDEKPYTCGICEKQFSYRTSLKNHLIIHTTEKAFTCETCKKQFSRRSSLKTHLTIHRGEKPYTCETCKKQFSRRSTLKAHLIIHKGEKPYTCETCKKQFSHRSTLANHKTIHTDKKLYTCRTCVKQFSRRSSLRNHEKIHTGEKSYTCGTCKKQFLHSNSLKMHERTHTREKPYTCETCKKQFSYISSLKNHEKIHTGEKPYTCLTCGKQFIQRFSLIEHERTHTGDKPYTCRTCIKQFSHKNSLKKHEESHSTEKSLYVSDL